RRINLLRTVIVTLLISWPLSTIPSAKAQEPAHSPPPDQALQTSLSVENTATAEQISAWSMPDVTYPSANPYSKNKAALGRKLFFDPRLSGNPSRTCAACHHPGLGWSDSMQRALGNQQGLGRHTPSLINVGYNKAFFWDGRATSLEDAVSQDMLSPGMEYDEKPGNIVKRISAIAAYRKEFGNTFTSGGVTFERIADALATFLRGIRSSSTPFDRWLLGDAEAIPDSAKRGFALFTGKAMCAGCHIAPNFTDSSFHNTGTNTVDPGYYEISGRDEDRNAFKTPSLRDVALTPPYMHNGSKTTLTEIIDYYNRGGDTLNGGNELQPLHLTAAEKADLLAFLLSLSGEAPETVIPALPLALMP
ncbi:MAG: cytochrome c peroxidase, partial [Mariprofundaceae bacterium]|nr:cytochrome c peroxidase [Mariprofundaceae bacterium]